MSVRADKVHNDATSHTVNTVQEARNNTNGQDDDSRNKRTDDDVPSDRRQEQRRRRHQLARPAPTPGRWRCV